MHYQPVQEIALPSEPAGPTGSDFDERRAGGLDGDPTVEGGHLYFLGVDIGGTKVAAAIADSSGRILAEVTQKTDSRGGKHVPDQILAIARELCAETGSKPSQIRGVAIGVPGAVNPVTSEIFLAPHLDLLNKADFISALDGHFGAKIKIENDVNLAIVGEASLGNAKGVHNCALLALGTGVGLGILLDGRLYRGHTGAAGEIANLPLGELSGASRFPRAGLEGEVSSAAIVSRYKAARAASVTTVKEIFDLLQRGDREADEVINSIAFDLAGAIIAIQAVLDLEMILLGGSVGSRPELVDRVNSSLGSRFPRPLDVRSAAFGARAGLVGAVCAAAKL